MTTKRKLSNPATVKHGEALTTLLKKLRLRSIHMPLNTEHCLKVNGKVLILCKPFDVRVSEAYLEPSLTSTMELFCENS